MFGRRPDGRRLRSQDPIIQITPYLMPMRCDAQVFLEHKIDYEKLSRYIVRKSREGEKITFMQILVAAYVRSISQNPEANRFIFNKQFYVRNNCSVSYTVLKDPQDTDSSETTVRILFDLTDTVFDVRDRMNDAVEKSRATDDGDFAGPVWNCSRRADEGASFLQRHVYDQQRVHRTPSSAASYLQFR